MSNPTVIPAPPELVQLVDPATGRCTQSWYRFFLALFLRTGGTNGPTPDIDGLTELALTIEDRGDTELNKQFNILAQSTDNQSQQLPLPLPIAALQTPQDPQQITWAQIASAPTPQNPDFLSWAQIASAPTPQDPSGLDPLLAALVIANEKETPKAAPEFAPAVGASPAVYTARYDGWAIVSGGTVTVIELSRDGGATYYNTGLTAGVFPMANGDNIRVTYGVAPTVHVFFPR